MSNRLVVMANCITEVFWGKERALSPTLVTSLTSMDALNAYLNAEAIAHNDRQLSLPNPVYWRAQTWENPDRNVYKIEHSVDNSKEGITVLIHTKDGTLFVTGHTSLEVYSDRYERAQAFRLTYTDENSSWNVEYQNPDALYMMRYCVEKLIELDTILHREISRFIIAEGGALATLFEANAAFE